MNSKKLLSKIVAGIATVSMLGAAVPVNAQIGLGVDEIITSAYVSEVVGNYGEIEVTIDVEQPEFPAGIDPVFGTRYDVLYTKLYDNNNEVVACDVDYTGEKAVFNFDVSTMMDKNDFVGIKMEVELASDETGISVCEDKYLFIANLLKGDLDGNGYLEELDMWTMYDFLNEADSSDNPSHVKLMDFDGNGIVDWNDYGYFSDYIFWDDESEWVERTPEYKEELEAMGFGRMSTFAFTSDIGYRDIDLDEGYRTLFTSRFSYSYKYGWNYIYDTWTDIFYDYYTRLIYVDHDWRV